MENEESESIDENKKKDSYKKRIPLIVFILLLLLYWSFYSDIKNVNKNIENVNRYIENLDSTAFIIKSEEKDIILEHFSEDPEPFSKRDIETYESSWAKEEQKHVKPENRTVVLTSKMLFGETNENQLTQKEWLGRAEVLYKWILVNFRYIPEPNEIKKYPEQTIQDGGGDCEDFAFLYLSLAIASGIPRDNIRIVFAEKTKAEEASIGYHSYIEIKYIIDNKEIWMPVEVTPSLMKTQLDFYFYKTSRYSVKRRIFWYNDKEIGVFIDG